MSYSIIGIIAIIIHITINKNNISQLLNKEADHHKRVYALFLLGILLYYIADTMWGLLDSLSLTGLLYADTVIYYVAMSLAVVLWSEYVVVYLEHENWFGRALRVAGRMFMMFEILALIINMHFPIFFLFNSNGDYEAGIVRYIALYIQIALFLFTSVQTFYVARELSGSIKRRYMTICAFGIAMTIAIVAQIEYPLMHIYSIGYLLGCCVLHIYVEANEKEESFSVLKHHMNVVSSMANMFFCSYYINMDDHGFIELDNKLEEVGFLIGKSGNAGEKFTQMSKYLALPQYTADLMEFCDLSTLNLRMRDRNHISIQFEGAHIGWVEGYFISGDRDEDGYLKHVIWAIRTIKDEKERESILRYNSYVDELTGLYNRKMYVEDTRELDKDPLKEGFTYMSMDVNGLKDINDTKGHAAGDELINGAAACMKKCLEPYGRVYRTGGDEFIAIIYATPRFVNKIKQDFDEETYNFSGRFVERISISCGIVYGKDCEHLTISEISKMADEKMYLDKRNYYESRGIDRRSKRKAYNALCDLYSKILKINIDKDTYKSILVNVNEQIAEKGFEYESILKWLKNFAHSGQVHPDDIGEYLYKTSYEYIKEYFSHDKKSLSISYRRMIDEEFKEAVMEIIPAEDYDEYNSSFYLYVRAVDK